MTTTELADEQVGGFLSAGPDRLTAAGRAGVPQVVSTGALDMVNFYGPESVPAAFKDRMFYRHNANVTLMRTTPDESARIGTSGRSSEISRAVKPALRFFGLEKRTAIARKLAAATGPVSVLLPGRGVSAIDKDGQPFNDPVARRALHDAIRAGLRDAEVSELDLHINDPEFADAAAHRLIDMMKKVH